MDAESGVAIARNHYHSVAPRGRIGAPFDGNAIGISLWEWRPWETHIILHQVVLLVQMRAETRKHKE